jgi:molybdopterin synthase sulfur carrier subunit
MPEVTIEVTVPALLADCTGGRTRVRLQAATLAEAIRRLPEAYPLLRVHLYEESGRLRRHVLLFYNDENTAWLPTLDLPLHPGDCLHVLQAVSGGAG